ncbi:hypothetical protein ABXT08_19345 [Chryseobacterium sp. NRRL B-14859]|uniref:hypothetical protein n=1 Tax=unclassified Chryseobacterium TaxID=2593645 RepID=UPI001E65779A|nr:hypothetical protein [Chryseobacterium sp. G0240]
MKKIILSLFTLVSGIYTAQSLNPTESISVAGSADNFKGGYTFAYVTSGTPWNGSLLSFGGFNNSYDTQLSADYGPNGGSHISFRTRNGDANVWNSWNELATKGANDFIGKQTIKGNLEVDGQLVSQVSSNEGGFIALENPSKTTPNTARRWTIYNMTGHYGNSLQFWNYSSDGTMYGSRLVLSDTGNMALYGKFEANEMKVTLTPTADFVFDEQYDLPKLEAVEKHIREKKHLPEIASAKEMEKEGVNIGEFQIKLLQKIEELTLYTIELNKQVKKQAEEIEVLKKIKNK